MAKGKYLTVPKGGILRPTSVQLRRRLFDSQQDWRGKVVFDLCAGTGSIGLEAWSRGAQEVFFVESSPRVLSALKKNINDFKKHFANEKGVPSLHVQKAHLPSSLRQLRSRYESWEKERQERTVFYLDPPYEKHKLYEAVGDFLFVQNWFRGKLYWESDEQKGIKQEKLINRFGPPTQIFIQGTSYLALFLFPR